MTLREGRICTRTTAIYWTNLDCAGCCCCLQEKKMSPKGRENNGSWKNARNPVRRGLGRDKGGKKKNRFNFIDTG